MPTASLVLDRVQPRSILKHKVKGLSTGGFLLVDVDDAALALEELKKYQSTLLALDQAAV